MERASHFPSVSRLMLKLDQDHLITNKRKKNNFEVKILNANNYLFVLEGKYNFGQIKFSDFSFFLSNLNQLKMVGK